MVDLVAQLLPFLYFGIIIVATWLLAKLAGRLLGRLLQETPPQVAATARTAGAVVVWLVGAVIAIGELGISPSILLVVIALLGVLVIVAIREQLENFGAKYFADVYTPFKVGDSIQIREYSGNVIEINSMSTILLSDKDQLVSIPNSLFMREVVVNRSPQAWKEVVFPITIPGSVDLPSFENELLKSVGKLRARLDRRFPPLLTTKARGPQSADLVLTLMLKQPEERDALVTEVNKRISETLSRNFPLPPR